MRSISHMAIGLFVAGLVVTQSGCSPQASALSKLQSGQIGSLTANEWVALEGLGTQLGIPIPAFTAQQAQLLVEFLNANNIETLDQLQQVIDSGNIIIPPEVVNLLFTTG